MKSKRLVVRTSTSPAVRGVVAKLEISEDGRTWQRLDIPAKFFRIVLDDSRGTAVLEQMPRTGPEQT